MSEGLLVSLEGIDGSGKSTVANLLAEEREDIYYTAQPSRLWTGDWTRQCIEYDKSDALTDFFMFQADRAEHLSQEIYPALNMGQTVVVDRYVDSTRTYQSELLNDAVENTDAYINGVMGPFPEPDLVFFIDVPVDVAIERTDGDEKYEEREFLSSVRDNYIELEREYDNIKRVDGQRDPETVAEGVQNIIEIFEE